MGMQLFGGKVIIDGEVPRANFNTLVWSTVTVFQVLTGEDWNQVMYESISGTDAWSSLYFVALISVGNYMVLNLFIAILFSNFSNPKAKEAAADVDGGDALKEEGMLAKVRCERGVDSGSCLDELNSPGFCRPSAPRRGSRRVSGRRTILTAGKA